jgi:hypothetical protein
MVTGAALIIIAYCTLSGAAKVAVIVLGVIKALSNAYGITLSLLSKTDEEHVKC